MITASSEKYDLAVFQFILDAPEGDGTNIKASKPSMILGYWLMTHRSSVKSSLETQRDIAICNNCGLWEVKRPG